MITLTKTVLSGRTGTTWNPGYSTSPSNNHCDSPCTYDSNGDVTGDGNDVYAWNEFSKLKWTATSGTPACGTSGRCAVYDAFGRMVESSNGTAWREYWYTQAGGKMVMNGTTLSYGRWPMPYGMAETVGTTNFDYLHKDWIGNSRIVSNISNNTVVADQAYTPYGEIYNIFAANNSEYQVFADTIADLAPSTTTPIMWDTPNRELSYTGHWLSPDPAGVGWNQYAYPTNPNSFGDPSGLIGTTYCLAVRPSGNAFQANAQGSTCSSGPYDGGGGDDGSGDGSGGDTPYDGWGDPFAGAGGPLISPLEGNPYDENMAALEGAMGPGPGNALGSVGADGTGLSAVSGGTPSSPDDPLDFSLFYDLSFGPCTNYVMANCGAPNGANALNPPGVPKPPNPILQEPSKGSCTDAVGEFGLGAGATVIEGGLVVAMVLTDTEVFAGIEGLVNVVHIGVPVSIAPTIMGQRRYTDNKQLLLLHRVVDLHGRHENGAKSI